jgi:dTMP kinase
LPLFDPSLSDANTVEVQASDRRAREEARFERFGVNFHKQLRLAFRDITARNPDRCILIDADETPELVEHAIWQTVSARFGI